MNSKRFLLIMIALLTVIAVPACTLSASTPPPTATPPESQFPVPGTETMDIFEAIATQTAMATMGLPINPTSQPVPGGDTAVVPTENIQVPEVTQAPEPAAPEATQLPPAVEVPEPTPGIPASYTIQKGEFAYCLARRFNVNPAELMAINGLGANTVLQPGTSLRIPQTGNAFPGERVLRSHPTTYTVRANDTIYSIACYFGDVDPNGIAIANSLSAPYNLSSGQTIHIP